MTASSLSFRLAVLFALAGMTVGIAMAASHDHSVMPAHAHLNLLGWVSLFLIGIFYRLHPERDASRLALLHVVTWAVATVILTVGVAAIDLGYAAGEPVAVVGSLAILAAMVMFAVVVFRPGLRRPRAAQLAPAE